MRPSFFLCIALLSAALAASPSPEPERPYLVIEETTSPNEKYAVVWSLPEGPALDWDKFRRGERNSDHLPDFKEAVVADNLIELKSGKVLASVASGYWALPGRDAGSSLKFYPDDEFMEVAWSAKSDFVVVLHRLRSGPQWGSMRAFRIEQRAVLRRLENGHELEAAARAHLKKVYRKEYLRREEIPSLSFDNLKSLGGASFSVNVSAPMVNEFGNRTYKGSIIQFELRPDKKGRLSLHVLGFSERDLEEAS
ncbi:MAG: hypothetical protein ABIU29_04525 [Chthoniobacterales bacterium]